VQAAGAIVAFAMALRREKPPPRTDAERPAGVPEQPELVGASGVS
jgi:hypothetical protein